MSHFSTRIFIHLVFTTRKRQSFVSNEEMRIEVEKYIAGVYKNKGHSLFAQHCMPDHYHGLFRLYPAESVSSLVRRIKSGSALLINRKFMNGAFQWQEGYGAFGHLAGDIEGVVRYVRNQPEEHARRSLEQEVKLLNTRYDANWLLD